MSRPAYSLKVLAAKIHADIQGDENCIITGIGTLQQAKKGELAFLSDAKYQRYLAETQASAVIIRRQDLEFCKTNALITEDPHYAYANLATLFAYVPKFPQGIHPSAYVSKTAKIHPTAHIGHHVVIEDSVEIGANAQIHAGCFIGANSKIGETSLLYPNVSVYHRVHIGNRVIIHSGTVIGSDGFGFAMHKYQWHKVSQLGGVKIGDDVEIGANTTIDRGAIEDTIISNGVKLDNQIQIGHNVTIGESTAIAGCVGIAGSTVIGKRCMIGGGAAINGHIEICDQVIITGMAMVTHSIKTPGIYSSGTGCMPNREWRKNAVRFQSLDRLIRQLKVLK